MGDVETVIIDHELPITVSPKTVIDESLQNGVGGLDFDPEALKAKYVREKEKRLNNGGSNQYRLATDLKDYAQDIWTKPPTHRAPVSAEYDVVIVGAGFTALQVACRLLENGYTNIALIERGGDVGGTWYWNRKETCRYQV